MIATKFADGAWMVIIAIPVLIGLFYAVRRHYRSIGRRLRAKMPAVLARPEPETPSSSTSSGWTRPARALWYARTIANGNLRAIHVPFPGATRALGRASSDRRGEPHLEILEPEDEPLDAVFDYIWGFPTARATSFRWSSPSSSASRRSCRR